jgi:transcriptional regulator with XRE-family HTH domain
MTSDRLETIQTGAQPAWEREPTPFCDWLVVRLRNSRMSQRQLAMRSGVHHSTISRLVRYRRTPSWGTAIRLAQVLDPTGAASIVRPASLRSMSPPMRVEQALRSDPTLSPTDVRDLMRGYLRLRARRTTPGAPHGPPAAVLQRAGRART